MDKNTRRFVKGTFIAMAAGYVAGILTAPKSGKETRKSLQESTSRNITEAEKKLKRMHTELGFVINDANEYLQSLKGKSKKEVQSAVKVSKRAKEKARDVLSAVHEGEVEDKDLQKALKDADKALQHLKQFLKKS